VVELILAIGIMSILVALMLPAVHAARESARRIECSNRVRQIAIALIDHQLTHRTLPSGTSSDRTNTPWRGWLVSILPSLEAAPTLLESDVQYGRGVPFTSHPGFRTHFPQLVCPSDGRIDQPRFVPRRLYYVALTSYLGMNGTSDANQDGVLYLDSRIGDRDIRDGLSQTLMIAERPPSARFDYGWWYAGLGVGRRGTLDHSMGVAETARNRFATCPEGQWKKDLKDECASNHFWSLHGDFANTAFCDGSIRAFSFREEKISIALATRWGDEITDNDSP
jgi:prepilin-type processing-associated H-X9-DG protein